MNEEIINSLENLTEEYKILKKNFQKKAENAFIMAIKEIFQEGQLEGIAWTQYTPYFNDGDTCEFNLGEIYFVKSGINEHGFPAEIYSYENEDDEGYKKYVIIPLSKPSSYYYEKADKDPYCKKVVDAWESISDKNFVVTLNKIASFMSKNDDLMEGIYGDHASITIYKNKDGKIETKVEEYEHY